MQQSLKKRTFPIYAAVVFFGALTFLAEMFLAGCGGGTNTTPAPPPASTADFTLATTPSSVAIKPSGSSSITVLATATGNFAGSVAITIDGLPAGVAAAPTSLTLVPGASQSIVLQAGSSAAPANYTVTFTGVSGSLKHTSSLALTIGATTIATGIDVTTYHYNNARDGLNSQESTLTLANVKSNTFGLLGLYPVDGRVDAEPLIVSGLTLQSGSTANVLYVATEHDSVYALDASNGSQIWKTSIMGAGETTSDTRSCTQISPEIGITSTPVIDRSRGSHGAIFVVGMTKDSSGKYHQRLHALDLQTGAELTGSPTEVTATASGTGSGSSNGTLAFDPGQYAERVGLLLLNGAIYTGWTSHCDIAPYTGWILGYDEGTLKQSAVLNLTPNGSEGSIWMAGFGLAADSSGNIFFLDANGTLDPGFTSAGFPMSNDYGNAMVKLSTGGGGLAVADYFEPYNTIDESDKDRDLGSGGAMLLPDQVDANGKTRHLVVGAGKDGNIYLADRDNMGKFNLGFSNNSNLYQELTLALPNSSFAGPAFFNGTLYYAGVNDALKAFPLNKALLPVSPFSESSATFPYPGSTPGVSANGTQNGIVWAVESSLGAAAVLHAYDASDLSTELYNSNQAGNRDAFGLGNKFITPLIANGHVYIGTPNSIAVFGLLNQ